MLYRYLYIAALALFVGYVLGVDGTLYKRYENKVWNVDCYKNNVGLYCYTIKDRVFFGKEYL